MAKCLQVIPALTGDLSSILSTYIGQLTTQLPTFPALEQLPPMASAGNCTHILTCYPINTYTQLIFLILRKLHAFWTHIPDINPKITLTFYLLIFF